MISIIIFFFPGALQHSVKGEARQKKKKKKKNWPKSGKAVAFVQFGGGKRGILRSLN